MQNFNITIWLNECHGLRRINEPVRLGIPLARGMLSENRKICVVGQLGRVISSQACPLCFWPDRSVKWLLLDIFANLKAHENTAITVISANDADDDFTSDYVNVLECRESMEMFTVSTGVARFSIPKKSFVPFSSVKLGTVEILSGHGSSTRLLDKKGNEYFPSVERWRMEENGPLRASLLAEGGFFTQSRKPALFFKARLVFFVNTSAVRVELQLRNPRAAVHPGGLWDLGDRGSFFFKDLSIQLQLTGSVQQLDWYAETPNLVRSIEPREWTLYQDSSGGENWNSRNHIDCSGNPSVSFRGYRIDQCHNGQSERLAEGNRATSGIRLLTASGWVAATVQDFWQNFPKALRWKDGTLSIGLFPGESRNGFELQGGEQKRHTVFLDFGLPRQESVIPMFQNPIHAWVDPAWVEETKAIPYFVAQENDFDNRYLQYIAHIVEGHNSFFKKRELIDEYGWRNFGDLYADHEAVNHSGPNPLISHYNNQYDFIYGALVHFLRTGDPRWRQLLDGAAHHTFDIDIYHTDQDKAAYNHGLFWHTDHYKDANGCTHRTYSWQNGDGANYGGGPSNEHNYTSGLLHYFYLTGDPEAAEAVLELGNWVLGMDDGSQTLLGLIDEKPTGNASQTVSPLYHKPGRGAGNSINALLDAYRLTNDRHYLAKADALIQRCVHPKDDITALNLDEPEYRWSYLVFLQVLGKYLDTKIEWGETDYCYYYARDSLLHYADWMLNNEIPYKDVLHRVELPTETWPAQDIRKCHVLYLAAKYGHPAKKAKFVEKANFFFDHCLNDLLSFDTAFLTRPLVILSVYGYAHAYFKKHHSEKSDFHMHQYDFGDPTEFLPQQARVKATLKRKLRIVVRELKRLLSAKGYELSKTLFKKI